jgi:hypothetical protein
MEFQPTSSSAPSPPALPGLAQALAQGERSHSKVRELTRVATPETDGQLLAVGRGARRSTWGVAARGTGSHRAHACEFGSASPACDLDKSS